MAKIQESIDKFTRYTISIERDLESLIFSMVDLIDSKTKTLRKLIKLHLHIKKVKAVTNSRYRQDLDSISYNKNDDSMIDSVDQMTFSECELSNCSEVPKQYQFEEVFEDIGFTSSEAETVDKCVTESTSEKQVRADSISLEDCPVSAVDRSTDVPDIADSCPLKEPFALSKEIEQNAISKNDYEQHPKPVYSKVPPAKLEFENKLLTSFCKYCIVSNLEGAINTLGECQPGDCGVYVDICSYKNIIDMLGTVLATYGARNEVENCDEPSRVVAMGKSSTQPALKGQYEKIPSRLSSSTTECKKNVKRKLKN